MSDTPPIHIPALEINIVEHCNLRCRHCDHSSPLLPPFFLSPEDCHRELSILSGVLHARELKVVGGEPLLHSALPEVLSACRESGISDTIILWTNGLLLLAMASDAWEKIDGIVISMYPGIRHPFKWCEIQPLLDKHSVWLQKRQCPQFMQSTVNHPLSNNSLVQHIYDTCSEAHYFAGHTVRSGRYFKCVQAAYAESRLKYHGVSFLNDTDGVMIDDRLYLREDICEYLACPKPLAACRYCLGDLGKWHPHRQMLSSEVGSTENALPGAIDDGWLLPQRLMTGEASE